MASIKSSELITNEDGSIFHLHLLPEDLADDIILVGDPGTGGNHRLPFSTNRVEKK